MDHDIDLARRLAAAALKHDPRDQRWRLLLARAGALLRRDRPADTDVQGRNLVEFPDPPKRFRAVP